MLFFEHTSARDCRGSRRARRSARALDLEGPLEDRRDLLGWADHDASRSECPCVLHRVHRSEGDFGLAAVLLEFLTARDVVGAVDPDQMPVSGDSLNQLALSCCVQSVWSDRRRCADRGLGCEFRGTHSAEPQAEGSRS